MELHLSLNVKKIWVCIHAASVPFKAFKWLLSQCLIFPVLEKLVTQQLSFLICILKLSIEEVTFWPSWNLWENSHAFQHLTGFLAQESRAKSSWSSWPLSTNGRSIRFWKPVIQRVMKNLLKSCTGASYLPYACNYEFQLYKSEELFSWEELNRFAKRNWDI